MYIYCGFSLVKSIMKIFAELIMMHGLDQPSLNTIFMKWSRLQFEGLRLHASIAWSHTKALNVVGNV